MAFVPMTMGLELISLLANVESDGGSALLSRLHAMHPLHPSHALGSIGEVCLLLSANLFVVRVVNLGWRSCPSKTEGGKKDGSYVYRGFHWFVVMGFSVPKLYAKGAPIPYMFFRTSDGFPDRLRGKVQNRWEFPQIEASCTGWHR